MSNIRVAGWQGGGPRVQADYAASETLRDGLTRAFSVGRCHDTLVAGSGGPKFKERLVVFDSELIPRTR